MLLLNFFFSLDTMPKISSMKFSCPYCQHGLVLQKPKVGSFRPKCNKCGKHFALSIEDGDPPRVQPLPQEVDGPTQPLATEDTEVTQDFVAPSQTGAGGEPEVDESQASEKKASANAPTITPNASATEATVDQGAELIVVTPADEQPA